MKSSSHNYLPLRNVLKAKNTCTPVFPALSPQVSARQVCQGPACVSCPAGATRGLFHVFFAPRWISSCSKENTYIFLKVVSLLWVVETVSMIIINHRTIEKVTSGPSAWNWAGLSPHKALFSLPCPGKCDLLSPVETWSLPDVIVYPSQAVCDHILTVLLTLTSEAFRQPLTPATQPAPSPSTLVQPLLLPPLLHSLLR